MIITLEQAKKHLNLTDDFVEDDEYITDLILVAENCIETDLHRTLTDIETEIGSVPAVLKHAAKLMISNFYENREPVIIGVKFDGKMPLSYEYLISKYKSYTVG